MSNRLVFGAILLAFAAMAIGFGCSGEPKQAEATTVKQQIERGEYLVTIGGCNHCHSPKIMTDKGPEIDPARVLSGHRSSSVTPGVPLGVIGPESWGALTNQELTAWAGPWGVSFAANLTPDEVTGIGAWLESSFIQAMRNGKHMGTGRPILPPMPWQDIGRLSDEDLRAMFAYFKSLKPINNMVPLPVAPEKMTQTSM